MAGVQAAEQTQFPQVPGEVILHSPKQSGRYVGSPGIAILPNGDYIAKCDLFGPQSNQTREPITKVFRSSDRGRTWSHVTDIRGVFWASPFVHEEALYLIGTSRRYGDVVIICSRDGGQTWTSPADECTGRLLRGQYHTAPMPLVIHNGRIWRAMEDAEAGTKWGHRFRAFMMSAPVDADLLRADSWTSTNRIGSDPTWLDGHFGGFLEGNAVVGSGGGVKNVLRVDFRVGPEKAAIIEISADGREASFDPQTGFVDFPGGCKKFTVRHDPESGLYWTLSNHVPPQHRGGNPERTRNTLALMSSPDLHNWDVRSIVLYHPDVKYHGFQYVDWIIEGYDIIAVSRTAYEDGQGGADNQHNANFLTFHRIPRFRELGREESAASWTSGEGQ
jgi:hypothetical protein